MNNENDPLIASEVMDPRHGPGSPGYQKLVKALVEAIDEFMSKRANHTDHCWMAAGRCTCGYDGLAAAIAALKEQ